MERIHISFKVRSVPHGCFCRSHSPITNKLIDDIISQQQSHDISYHEHETGPEIIAWLALGTAGLTVTKSLIDLITAIINACKRGSKNGDKKKEKLVLIIRDEHKTDTSAEEFALEIYENDVITPEVVQKSIEAVMNKKHKKNGGFKK